MVRSVGIAAVVVGLAWTGLAGAQSSSPLEKSHYINVTEEGKSPQRCKLLKTWHEPNGVAAFQVQAVDTGELMTIVGTTPQLSNGDPREMSTRIFRWGRSSTPPAGAPVPPPTGTALSALPGQTAPVPATRRVVPQPIRPSPIAVQPRMKETTLTVKPTAAPSLLTNSKPNSSAVASTVGRASQPVPDGPESASYTHKGSQPRLMPLAEGSHGDQNPCNCVCPPPCPANCKPCKPCKPCNPCCRGSCVCDTPSPMRQPFISRLLKPKSCSPCPTACQPPPKPEEKPAAASPPAPIVVKTTTEPAKSSDWRQSWGKVEPWNGSAQANIVKPIEVSKRADPMPAQMEPATHPDPIKDPDHYRDIVMNARLANSKIPQEKNPPSAAQPKKGLLSTLRMGMSPAKQPAEPMPPAPPAEEMAASAPSLPRGTVVVPADEPNAFWSPQTPQAGQEKSKINAFDRQPDSPPQGVPPTIAGVPPSVPGVPPSIPRVGLVPMPPRGPMVMNPPRPPVAPMTRPSGPPRPMSPDTGVPNAMGNAFTLSGTSRPIPADFGGTPQEPNGFDPPMQMGGGSPPRAYGMGMPGTYRPPMPNNMMPRGQQAPMAVNPLMSVPPGVPTQSVGRSAARVFANASARPTGVPQLLASLKDSMRPSEREAAAEKLSELNWQVQPLVVESLMKSAREDPAVTVRAACIHALGRMKVATPEARGLVRDLKSDRDPLVRQEAEQTLNALGDPGVQQASHK